MRFALHITLVLIAAELLSGCNNPVDINKKIELKARADIMASGDQRLEGTLDLTRPAVIEAFKNTPHNSLRPACNGYCLRLLYSGEAKTVISGFLADSRYFIETGAWQPDKELLPSDWEGTIEGSQGLRAVVKAFHLERRAHCPDAPNEESWAFLPKESRRRPSGPSIAEQAELQMASGNCLIGEPATLGDASVVLVTTFEDYNDYKRHLQLNARHLTAYGVKDGVLNKRYRKTVSLYSYVPLGLPPSFDDAQFDARTQTDRRSLVEVARQELGLKLNDPAPIAIDLRQAVDNSLGNAELDKESSRWVIVDLYLRKLSETRKLEPADIVTLAGIISDARLSYHFYMLAHAIKPNAYKTGALAEPLLGALLSLPVPTDSEGRVSKSWGRQGGGTLGDLAQAFALLPPQAVRANEELLLRLVADPERMELTQLVIVQLSAVTPARALPVLRRIIDDNRDIAAIRLAMQAICEMGPSAAPLKSTVSEWLAGHPVVKGNSEYALSMTAQNAKVFLTNLKQPGSQSCEHLDISF